MKTFESFNKGISWNTKFYILLALSLMVFGYNQGPGESYLFRGALIALIIVIVVDYLEIISNRYPAVWKTLKVFFLLTLVLLTLIGAITHSTL